MRTKKVNRYYCDHCKKSGCSSYHMKRHESSCTANPNRTCMFCKLMVEHYDDHAIRPLADMVAEVEAAGLPDVVTEGDCSGFTSYTFVANDQVEATVKDIESATDGCPVCMLAVARALKARHGDGMHLNVGFEKRRDSMFSDWRDADSQCEYPLNEPSCFGY